MKADQLRALDEQSIGREHFRELGSGIIPSSGISDADTLIQDVATHNTLRAQIAANYLLEMQEVFSVCYRLLRPGGTFVLVSGSNTLCGRAFHTTQFLRQLCDKLGFELRIELSDVIKSRGLMTRRNKTAGLIPLESVIVFRK